jgi:hypothetical protein
VSLDVDMVEATDLHEALQFVAINYLSNIIIDLDAKKIVNAFQKKYYPRTNWGQLVKTCSRVCD